MADGSTGLAGYGIRRGLDPAHRDAAARLFWLAFGGKLGRLMHPEHRALALITAELCPDHAFAALAPDGALLGIAGFRSPQGSFLAPGPVALRSVYGRSGARWRGAMLGLLQREIDNRRFLVDGIVVHPAARRQGIGTALVGALCNEAAVRGYGAIRLDVAERNHAARALYERLGFHAERRKKAGVLGHVLGTGASVTMVRPVGCGVAGCLTGAAAAGTSDGIGLRA